MLDLVLIEALFTFVFFNGFPIACKPLPWLAQLTKSILDLLQFPIVNLQIGLNPLQLLLVLSLELFLDLVPVVLLNLLELELLLLILIGRGLAVCLMLVSSSRFLVLFFSK
jgi:hypothetical protein